MLIDRSHFKWCLFTVVLLLVATIAYLLPIHGATGPRGGSIAGIVYGTLGFAMMMFAGLLSARKKFPAWRIGSAQAWLRGHIWLGLLSVPMILFHSGFGWGGGLEKALWILFGVVIASGIFGLAVQQVLPRLLTIQIPLESFVEQLPYLVRRSQFLMDKAVSDLCGQLEIENDPLVETCRRIVTFTAEAPKEQKDNWDSVLDANERALFLRLATYAKEEGQRGGFKKVSKAGDLPREFPSIYANLEMSVNAATSNDAVSQQRQNFKSLYLDQIRPLFGNRRPAGAALVGLATAEQKLVRERMYLPQDFLETIDKLRSACEELRQYIVQQRIHRWLHGWLLLHVPLSMTLFALVIVHIVTALRVVPFSHAN